MASRFHIYSLNCRYLQLNWRYFQLNWRYLQIGVFGDTHVYANELEICAVQLEISAIQRINVKTDSRVHGTIKIM